MAGKSILLIDHEASVREVLQICLSDLGGWNVTSVASVQEGIEKLNSQKPDAILLDVPISKVEGFGFIYRLKNNPLTKSIPILLITSKASWFTRKQLQEIGLSGAIAKPFNPTHLPIQISQMLGWEGEPSKDFAR